MWKHTAGSKVHDALFPKYNMADGSQVRARVALWD
jgi:hypothetical protein